MPLVPPLARLRGALVCLTVVLAAFSWQPGGQAADPISYTVQIAPSGEAALDSAAHDASVLASLRTSAPVGPFALVARAQDEVSRLTAVLHSFGYYAGQVSVAIAGHPLADPALPDLLQALPAGAQADIAVTLTPGPRFHLRDVVLRGDVPAGGRAVFGLAPGQPAVAANVLGARDRLLKWLRDTGHALAKVSDPAATLVPAEQALDVSFTVAAGPRVDLGPIAITGLQSVHEDFVRRRLLLHPGEQFSPAAIEKARQDLANVGVFSTVRIAPPDGLDAQGRLPMEVALTERPHHVVDLGAQYSTDLGVSVTASWTHRNLFGNAERLTLSAAATELGGTAATEPGYNLAATLAIPDWRARDQTLTFSAQAVSEYLIAYDRTAVVLGATVSRKLNPDWTVSVGLTTEEARIKQEEVSQLYTLLQAPLSAQFDNTHDLLNPTHGLRASLSVTPTESFVSPGATFVIAQAAASTYLDLSGGGRSVLAMRGLIGGVEGASSIFAIPPDQRFYAGGSGTIRGFRFQSVGPQFPDGVPQGGTSIDAGSVEFRQRFGASYGAVVFADAGQLGTRGLPFEGKLQVGVGAGARYYTSFGPIRLDVAVPVTHQSNSDALEVYIGIGQAF
jgi:translocation and assembly module TamA